MKLLIVEDAADLRELLAGHFIGCGYVVDAVGRADEACAALALSTYDAMLLDLGLPDAEGLTLIEEARRRVPGGLPTIIVTARDALADRLGGLDAGADDYLVKPFDLLELEARLRAVLRRPGERRSELIHFGKLTFDIVSRDTILAGERLDLTRRETALLEALIRNAGRTVVRDALEERLYAFSEPVTPNALEALVSRLRRRLGETGVDVAIETHRGIGYRMVARVAA